MLLQFVSFLFSGASPRHVIVLVDVAQPQEQMRWGGGVAQGGAHLPIAMPPLVLWALVDFPVGVRVCEDNNLYENPLVKCVKNKSGMGGKLFACRIGSG